jgi:hypothetical protein
MNSVFKVMFKIWLLEEMILWVSNVFYVYLTRYLILVFWRQWPILVLVLVLV